jgi:subtilase family serine protease
MGITGLHNFRLKARVRPVAAALRPEYTSGGTHYMVPGDFYKIYNETPLLTAGTTGSGVNIAILGQTDILLSDIAAFRSAAGLSANAPTVMLYGCDPGIYTGLTSANLSCDGGYPPESGDLAEASLDIEWSGATAPAANIIYVNSNDVLDTSLTDAIDNNIAPIVSITYGECEASWGTNEMIIFNTLLKTGNSMGITTVAPAGDAGATDCDDSTSTTIAVSGLAVDFPGSSPYATAMGGTQFNEGTGSYWSSSQSTFSAGTAVPGAVYSALSYIPESAWSDVPSGYFGGGGGGPSGFFTKPYWQKGTGVPADASRDVPDLALTSSDLHDGYLYCADGSCASGFAGTISAGNIAGGTSFAAPTFAGLLALVEQKTAARIGNANPTIYALANNSTYYVAGSNSSSNAALVFNDVTTGNNDNPCRSGTPYCPNGGDIGYSAGSGYDLTTGWGNANALVSSWSSVTPIASSGPAGTNPSVTVASASPTSVAAAATVTLSATVTSGSSAAVTAPTGTVQFLVNNATLGSPVTLTANGTSSTATYSWVTSCATLGQQIIEASYSGDATYAGSKGSGITSIGFTTNANSVVTPVEVNVTSGTCPTFTLSGPSSSVSVAAGGTPVATITVAPLYGFTGTVVFSASAVSNTGYAPGFSFSPSSVTTSGTTTLTLTGITADLRKPLAPGQRDSGTELARTGHRAPWYAAGSGAAIAALLLVILPRKRRLGGLLLIVLSLALIGGATGCGGASNGQIAASSGTNYAGTYLVTVVGTSTSGSTTITASTTVTFVVQ